MSTGHPTTLEPLSMARTSRWHRFVDEHEATTPFHTRSWMKAVSASFSYDDQHRLVFCGEDLVGVIPGFRIPSVSGFETTNPFCAYGFPLLREGIDAVAVLEALASDEGLQSTRIIKDVPWSGVRGYGRSGYGATETGQTWRLELDAQFETLWDLDFDTTLRTKIRKARKNLSVRKTTETDAFYRLYCQTMRRNGSPPFPRQFIDCLIEEFGSNATLLVADAGGETVAGLLGLDGGPTRSLFVAGSDPEHWDRYPNDLLYEEQIRRACDEPGIEVVDFGRTDPGSGVDEFKRQFGARSEPLYSFVTPPWRAGRASVSTYRRLEPISRRLSPVIANPTVGPKLKEWIHE